MPVLLCQVNKSGVCSQRWFVPYLHLWTARVTWFHATNNTCATLPADASFQTVQKFGTTILSKDPLMAAEDTARSDLAEATNSYGSFDNFLSHQPCHVQCLLGNLDTAHINVECLIDAINRGTVTIATDGLVSNKKGYFATILYTGQQQLWFQGSCDGASSLMTSY
eukprot:1479274-Ditylum_brightwellii.AAC.1